MIHDLASYPGRAAWGGACEGGATQPGYEAIHDYVIYTVHVFDEFNLQDS